MNIKDKLLENPVIAAVRSSNEVELATKSECSVVFLLSANIATMKQEIWQIQSANKLAYVHVDLMEGLARDWYGLEHVKNEFNVDGIISTHSGVVKNAGELGIHCIKRQFMIDSQSIETAVQSVSKSRPEAIELMPGIMPIVIKKMCSLVSVPVIAGGLISEKKEVIAALDAGAMGVSTGNPNLWNI